MKGLQSPSFNSSVASSLQYECFEDVESTRVKNYVKETLKSRIFLGRYIERRLINQRVGYRDIVVVSAAELELKRDLLEVQHKLSSAIKVSWIGITDTDSIGCSPAGGVCICTEIDNQPFGAFWFQIKTLKFRDEEVIVILKCIRHITDGFLEVEPILTGGTTKKYKETSLNKAVDVSLNETYNDIVVNLKSALSISNVKDFFTFLLAFVIAIFTGSTAFVNFLGNFILALIREMSNFVKNSTPMFLGVLDFFSKIVGGFYILLAMLFKQQAPMPIDKRRLTYYGSVPRQDVTYDDGQFD
ncbi:Uncharacterized protein OBRU01_16734 [Operophtera brumata]|uniref:Uncharacterized protein n=1 Tax=Operophtera brumata TaxID=104452 RepID=A0A0L7L1V0_OPEBR|nr:Uncharacterized protein OBRU01_16734 [Operophtera brumata]